MASPPKQAPIDFSKKTKFELDAEKQEAKEAKAKAVATKLFNPVELMKSASTITESEAPGLGLVKYGELTLDDSFTISKCKSDEDKSSMAAYLMLKKAYPEMPTFTPENIKRWAMSMPMAEGASLLLFLSGTPAFLRAQSLRGYAPTKTHKQ